MTKFEELAAVGEAIRGDPAGVEIDGEAARLALNILALGIDYSEYTFTEWSSMLGLTRKNTYRALGYVKIIQGLQS